MARRGPRQAPVAQTFQSVFCLQISNITGTISGCRAVCFLRNRFKSVRIFSFMTPQSTSSGPTRRISRPNRALVFNALKKQRLTGHHKVGKIPTRAPLAWVSHAGTLIRKRPAPSCSAAWRTAGSNQPDTSGRNLRKKGSAEWKYRVEGSEPNGRWLVVVVSFKAADTACLITVFCDKARRREA